MTDVNIRKARLEDLEKLLEFEQAIVEYERPFEETMITEHFNYYDLADLINCDDAEVLVAESNGKLIGSGYAKIKKSLHFLKDENHSFLGFMYVEPDFRGKGVNKLIIEQLLVWSKNQGMNEIRLTVYDENSSAVRAYEKMGFSKNIVEMRMGLD